MTQLIEWELRGTRWNGRTRPEAFTALGLKPVDEQWVARKKDEGGWVLTGTFFWRGRHEVERRFLNEIMAEAERLAGERMADRVARHQKAGH